MKKYIIAAALALGVWSCNTDGEGLADDPNEELCKTVIKTEVIELREFGTLTYKDYLLITFIDRTQAISEETGINAIQVGEEICDSRSQFDTWQEEVDDID